MRSSLSLQCETRKCVAYETDLRNYATQHDNKESRAEDLNVGISSLNAVLTIRRLSLTHTPRGRQAGQIYRGDSRLLARYSLPCSILCTVDGLGSP